MNYCPLELMSHVTTVCPLLLQVGFRKLLSTICSNKGRTVKPKVTTFVALNIDRCSLFKLWIMLLLPPWTNVTRDYCLPRRPFWESILKALLRRMRTTLRHWLPKWRSQVCCHDDVRWIGSIDCASLARIGTRKR